MRLPSLTRIILPGLILKGKENGLVPLTTPASAGEKSSTLYDSFSGSRPFGSSIAQVARMCHRTPPMSDILASAISQVARGIPDQYGR